jgi:hypothetical protein
LAGRLLSCGSVVVLLIFAAPFAKAQYRSRKKDDEEGRHFLAGEDVGPSIVTGNARAMTGSGGMLWLTFGFQSQRRLSIPLDFGVDFSNLPTAVKKAGGVPNGEGNFILLGLEPRFALLRGRHWGAYAIGGGGLSWKEVVMLVPSSSCYSYYGCYAPSAKKTTFQPYFDAGAEIDYRFGAQKRVEMYAGARYLKMDTPQGQFPGFQSAGTGMWEPMLGCRVELGRPAQQAGGHTP